MSQAIQRGIIILTVLLVAAIGIAGFALYQKKMLEDKNSSLQDELTESKNKQEKALLDSKKFQQDVYDLKQRILSKDKEKDQLQGAFDDLKKKSDELTTQIDQATQDREEWKTRIETVRKERDDLMNKLKNQPVKIVYKEKPAEPKPAEVKAPEENPEAPAQVAPAAAVAATPALTNGAGDEYWANILKLKAQLEVQLDKTKSDLDAAALQVGELRKQNSELQLQIKELNNDKMEIDRRLTNEKKMLADSFDKERQDLQRKLKDQQDLADNLSMEVAHARGDQKVANDFVGKVKDDNTQMQSQIRQLSSSKVALEKTVTRLTQERNDMSKKLAETEGVIQDRINEIWQIKQTLDQKISQINTVKNGGEVELPPIVVNASGSQSQADNSNQPHKIISINEKNNFAIIDWGESQGSAIGRILKVYRGNNQIASLEVIQVRRDISAADIKDQKSSLQIGDQVR